MGWLAVVDSGVVCFPCPYYRQDGWVFQQYLAFLSSPPILPGMEHFHRRPPSLSFRLWCLFGMACLAVPWFLGALWLCQVL